MKLWSRIRWIGYTVVLLVALYGIAGSIGVVHAETNGEYTYSLINDGTEVEITGYSYRYIGGYETGNPKHMTNLDAVIPSVINGKPVTSIKGAFAGKIYVTSVTIPDSVTTIGDKAFSGCTGIRYITIPDSVTKIGDKAFSGCTGIGYITIPDSVTNIGESAFSGCGLKGITIPDSVTTIGERAFYNCGLTQITIPNSVTSIGDGAFAGTKLETITLPINNDGTVFTNLFSEEMSSIEEVIITRAESIPDKYFLDWNYLKSIELSDGITSIGEKAFSGCTGLTSIEIPDSVTMIGNSAFSGCTGLRGELKIPEGVIEIGNYAFYNLKKLTKITVSGSVAYIGQYAFSGCDNVEEVVLQEGIKSLGQYAFKGCTKLNNVVIPDSVESIRTGVFAKCQGLTSITLGSGINDFSQSAFTEMYGTSSGVCLKEIVVSEENKNYSVQDNVLFDKDKTTLVMYPTGDKRTSYSIPEGVKWIGDSAFFGVSYLREIILPDTVEQVRDYAFANCSLLEEMVFPVKTSSIGSSVFDGCKSLDTVTFWCFNSSCSSAPANTIIKGYINSAAQKMAENNNLRFISLGEYKCEQHKPESSWNISYMPTSCTQAGYRRYTCILCGEQVNEEIPMLEHNWSQEYEYVEEPTCTTKGTEAIFCQYCNAVKDGTLREVDMLAHTEVTDRGVAVTCMGAGKTEGSHCGVCGVVLVEQKEIPAIGHHGDTELRDAKEATETTDGYTGDTYCKVCGDKLQEGSVIKATGVKPADTSTPSDGENTPDTSTPSDGENTPDTSTPSDGEHTSDTSTPSDGEHTPDTSTPSDGEHTPDTSTPSDDEHTSDTSTPSDGEQPSDTVTSTDSQSPSDTKQKEDVNLSKVGSVETDDETKSVVKITNPGTIVDGKAIGAEVEYTKPSDSATMVVIPEAVTIDGIAYKVTSIAANAFKNDKKLTKITIGENITSIGANAFSGCTKLKTVSMGANVTTIGDKAFYNCTSLTKLTIPAKVDKIGKQAFCGCKKLKSITIKTTKLTSKRIGSKAFKGIHQKATIKVPKKKLVSYKKILKKKGVGSKMKIKK